MKQIVRRIMRTWGAAFVIVAVFATAPAAGEGNANQSFHVGADQELACDTKAKQVIIDLGLLVTPSVSDQSTFLMDIGCEGLLDPPPDKKVKGRMEITVSNQSGTTTTGSLKANYNRQGRVEVDTAVPILGDLPSFVGFLFKGKGNTTLREGTRHELICILTPRIVAE